MTTQLGTGKPLTFFTVYFAILVLYTRCCGFGSKPRNECLKNKKFLPKQKIDEEMSYFEELVFSSWRPSFSCQNFSHILVIESLSQDRDSDLDSANPGPQHYSQKQTVSLRRKQIINIMYLSVPLCTLQFPVDFHTKLCDLSLLRWPLFMTVHI